ncbi:hypothetical protein [Kribbella orskensis]|uniref:hypothetical protein n=1 Tax=Kribbella TaxID=182639 RepID=UPI0034E1B86C
MSLKPSDESHAQMKNDMTGSAAVLASMTALGRLGCTTVRLGLVSVIPPGIPSGERLTHVARHLTRSR